MKINECFVFLIFSYMIVLRGKLFSLAETLGEEIRINSNLILGKIKDSVIARFLSRFKYFRKYIEKGANYNIIDKATGKTVGEIQIFEEIPGKELNIVWLDIDSRMRGKHYATDVMRSVIELARGKGYQTITLEVPGISPDAKHIYEKLGFKVTDRIEPDPYDIWGGLTSMELKL